MAKWLENCQICNDGLIMRIEELKKEGHSERAAVSMMEMEALKEYPEMVQEFNADRLRHRYRYHMKGKVKNDVGENLPPQPVTDDQWPTCKKCGSWPVKKGGSIPISEPDENGLTTYAPAPAKHGLCRHCRKQELREKKLEKIQCEIDEKAKEIELTPINPEAERDWTRLAEQLERLWTLEEIKTGTGETYSKATFNLTIGKVSLELLERVNVAFELLYDEIEEVRGLSQAPTLSI